MKDKILEKISKELKNGINTEAKVVYLLVEIKKILDLTNNRTASLKIFRDWALHSELTYQSTIAYFTNKFEPYIDVNSNSKDVGKAILTNQKNFFKLNELKTELGNFLKSNKLQTDIVDDTSYWIKFITLLLEVLKECPITINSLKIEKLTITEDKNGINCYRIKLKNYLSDKKNIIKIKLKIKQSSEFFHLP